MLLFSNRGDYIEKVVGESDVHHYVLIENLYKKKRERKLGKIVSTKYFD
jgi:hypothetical protein